MATQLKKPSLFPGALLTLWSKPIRSSRALSLFIALSISACGFEPIYKYDGTQSRFAVSIFELTGEGTARAAAGALRRQLESALRRDEDAGALSIKLSERVLEMQKGADGIARRLEVTYSARLLYGAGETGITRDFALTQYMTRSESASDEMTQKRALADLAARELARQIASFLASLPQSEEPSAGEPAP